MTHGPSSVDLGGLEGLGLVEGVVWNRTLGPWDDVRWGYKSTKAFNFSDCLLNNSLF